jgi:hypothetical protein
MEEETSAPEPPVFRKTRRARKAKFDVLWACGIVLECVPPSLTGPPPPSIAGFYVRCCRFLWAGPRVAQTICCHKIMGGLCLRLLQNGDMNANLSDQEC